LEDRVVVIYCMGRELLEGVVLDRNANFMASNVHKLGFRVRTIQVVDAVETEAVEAFRLALAKRPAFILVTGGMGPGNDDITRQCVAKAAGVPLVPDETARQMLANAYRRLHARGVVEDPELNAERIAMASIPKGAVCHENPVGTAPALRLDAGPTTFFLLPGAPEEMRRMFQDFVAPTLESFGPSSFRFTAQIDYPGGDESAMSKMLADLSRRHPGIQSRARVHGVDQATRMRITLATEGTERDAAQELLQAAAADLRARLGLEVAGNQIHEGHHD
jgi:nicotinamide-nucleotide amidase